ncbi:hypothetical protein ACIRP0_20785 [Streptomyces sp. NPDC101733]|uniref:hypothetical protein n=1 Tax=unclassified Streptomyces TaxID=2593676 RepID=UPI003804CD88
MFEYEIATARHQELIHEAERYRMAREARTARKADRSSSRSQEAEGSVRGHRGLFTRAA